MHILRGLREPQNFYLHHQEVPAITVVVDDGWTKMVIKIPTLPNLVLVCCHQETTVHWGQKLFAPFYKNTVILLQNTGALKIGVALLLQ